MCKYCKLNPTGVDGEVSNDIVSISSIHDGSQIIDVSLYRYIDEDNDYHKSELVLSESIVLRDGAHTVKEKHINIKYCPFCGEKL